MSLYLNNFLAITFVVYEFMSLWLLWSTLHIPWISFKGGYVSVQAIQLNKFDYRLANRLDTDLQKLRCRVNYHALKFTDPIQQMAKMLVNRMRMRSKHYIALHLRYSGFQSFIFVVKENSINFIDLLLFRGSWMFWIYFNTHVYAFECWFTYILIVDILSHVFDAYCIIHKTYLKPTINFFNMIQ